MKLVLLLLLCANFAFAKFPESNSYNNANQNDGTIGFTGEYPYDKSKLDTPKDVQKKRFMLKPNPKIVKKLRKDLERRKNILDGTLDIAILQKPIIKPLKTIDTLYLHSNFITTIIFPKSLTITKAGASFETREFSHSQNTLLLQPTNNARNGNIVISLSDGKKNYMMTIFVKQYFPEDNCEVKGENYKCSNDYLATIIKYKKERKLTMDFKLQLLQDYLNLHGIKKLSIPKNLDYLVLKKNEKTYYIVRDDEFGNIYKSGLSLTIKNSIN